jgi:hypothetical protein
MPNVANAAADAAGAGKRSLKHRALHELEKYAVITAYLWLLFALFDLYRWQLLNEHGIVAWRQTFAIVNALVFGKVVLLGQALEVGKSLERRSLAWIVLGKSLIFALLLIAFHVAEELVAAWFTGRSLSYVFGEFGGAPPRQLTYAAIFLVTLIPFFAFQEVARVLGPDSLRRLFFRRGAERLRLVED